MSGNCILKLSVETEDEKYLAVVVPQLQLNCYLCYFFISKEFSPKKLNDFSSVCPWGNILIIFQTTEKFLDFQSHVELQESYQSSFVKLLCIFCNKELMWAA